MLCSMAGDVFPRGSPGDLRPQQAAKAAHLRRFLPVLLQWLCPPEQALQQALGGREGPLLDACRCAAVRLQSQDLCCLLPLCGLLS